MKDFEFLAYEQTPNDHPMVGVVTLRYNGKMIIHYKHIKTQDGGDFFAPLSFGINKGGEKKQYTKSGVMDSNFDQKTLLDAIHEFVKTCMKGSVIKMADNALSDTMPF